MNRSIVLPIYSITVSFQILNFQQPLKDSSPTCQYNFRFQSFQYIKKYPMFVFQCIKLWICYLVARYRRKKIQSNKEPSFLFYSHFTAWLIQHNWIYTVVECFLGQNFSLVITFCFFLGLLSIQAHLVLNIVTNFWCRVENNSAHKKLAKNIFG